MKRLLACCVATLSLCSASLTSAADAQPITIRFSHVVAPDSPKGQGARLFKQLVEQRLPGKVRVEVYPQAQLFSDSDELQALLDGKVEMLAPSLAKFSDYAPELQVFDLPFLFKDMAAIDRFQHRPQGRQLLLSMTDRNIIGLDYWHNGMKQLLATRPLRLPAEAARLGFRIQNSPVSVAQFAALGATGKPMPFSQMRTALSSGEVQGTENTWSNFASQRLDELQPYVTETNHGVIDYMLVSNARFWYGIPHDIRSELEAIIEEVSAEVNRKAAELNAAARQQMLDSGNVQVISLSDEQLQAWRSAMQPVWQQFEAQIGAKVIRAALRASK